MPGLAKDKRNPLSTAEAYQIPCSCGQEYIGTTKHSIQTRIKEHERHCRLKQPEKSAVAEHTLKQTGHVILFQDTKVMDNTTNHYVRLHREAIEIHKHKHSFNKKTRKCKNKKSLASSTKAAECKRVKAQLFPSSHKQRSAPWSAKSQRVAIYNSVNLVQLNHEVVFCHFRNRRTVIHPGGALVTEPSSMPSQTVDAATTNMTQVEYPITRNAFVLLLGSCIIEPITILGLLGNGSIFWFLCCRIKRTKYTVYVLNLSVADFIVLICHNYFFITQFVVLERETVNDYLYDVLDILGIFGYNSSFFLLTAISVERCLGACYPLWYHFNRPKHLSTILCAIFWVVSCAATAVEYLTTWTTQFLEEVPCRMHTAACMFLITIWLIFIPVMVFCSVSLFIKLRRNSRPMSSARLYISIVITVVLFLILTVPVRVLYLIVYWHPVTQLEWTLLHFSFFLHTLNSCLNPFVYFLVGRQKHKRSHRSLYAVIYRSCKDETEVVPQNEHLGAEQER
ncbi:hypothetical protein JRQ81_009322 [Phrynocephalus forsythii]|uniref:G-protein coupled receptors family 1 profile domain-containing protein n=1 Tax=Phrynocephalus forsythii TaxID=171643 RepID=A0A9Q0Y5L8_9SAUR|nr:hypothetical protein JRQ81_009322 [Phrynocephalus forsythii]